MNHQNLLQFNCYIKRMEQDSTVNLKWDAHQATLKSVFDTLLDAESLADCTVGAEGQHLKAHKIMLSACSKYFELLFSHHSGQHTVIILPGVQYHILKALITFMYRGEVLIPQSELDTLLNLANFLQVKGLSYADNVVSKNKQAHKRGKSPTYSEYTPSHCAVSAQSYEHCDSPELLEVSDNSSHSECLQKQDFMKVTPSTTAHKRKKSNCYSPWGKPPLEQGLVPLLKTVAHDVPLQTPRLPDKHNLSHGMFSDPVSGPSLTSQWPVVSEKNFCEETLSVEKLISAKSLNSGVKTSVCPAVSKEKPILQTTETKQENYSGFSEDHGTDLMLDSDDTQHQKTCDNSVVMSVVNDSSFCDEGFFTRQMQFQVTRRTPSDPPERTLASYNRFKCQSCYRSYRQRGHLTRHLKYECGKEPQFHCPHCSVRYTHKHTLKAHMVRHNH